MIRLLLSLGVVLLAPPSREAQPLSAVQVARAVQDGDTGTAK